jgi:hypothetical protein
VIPVLVRVVAVRKKTAGIREFAVITLDIVIAEARIH